MARRCDPIDFRVRRLSEVQHFHETLLPALGFPRGAKIEGWLQHEGESDDGVSGFYRLEICYRKG